VRRSPPLGWQPSRFLVDRAEAEHAFTLAEELGSINAAATELETTWPLRRIAFTRHGLGMPSRNPRRSASAPSPRPAGTTANPPRRPGPGVRGPQPGRPPSPRAVTGRAVPGVRREEQYAILGANVVVELYIESHARQRAVSLCVYRVRSTSMADPEQLAILRQGSGAWNHWRAEHAVHQPDLTSAFHVGVVAVAWVAVGWCERRPGSSGVTAGAAVLAAGDTWDGRRAAWREPIGMGRPSGLLGWVSSAAAGPAAG
jgi:hypothetical protein